MSALLKNYWIHFIRTLSNLGLGVLQLKYEKQSTGYGAPPRAADEGRFCPKGIQPNKGAPAQLSSCSSTSSTSEQEQNQFNDTEDLGVQSMIPHYYSHKLFARSLLLGTGHFV